MELRRVWQQREAVPQGARPLRPAAHQLLERGSAKLQSSGRTGVIGFPGLRMTSITVIASDRQSCVTNVTNLDHTHIKLQPSAYYSAHFLSGPKRSEAKSWARWRLLGAIAMLDPRTQGEAAEAFRLSERTLGTESPDKFSPYRLIRKKPQGAHPGQLLFFSYGAPSTLYPIEIMTTSMRRFFLAKISFRYICSAWHRSMRCRTSASLPKSCIGLQEIYSLGRRLYPMAR